MIKRSDINFQTKQLLPLKLAYLSKYVFFEWIGFFSSFNSCFTFWPILRLRPGMLSNAEMYKNHAGVLLN